MGLRTISAAAPPGTTLINPQPGLCKRCLMQPDKTEKWVGIAVTGFLALAALKSIIEFDVHTAVIGGIGRVLLWLFVQTEPATAWLGVLGALCGVGVAMHLARRDFIQRKKEQSAELLERQLAIRRAIDAMYEVTSSLERSLSASLEFEGPAFVCGAFVAPLRHAGRIVDYYIAKDFLDEDGIVALSTAHEAHLFATAALDEARGNDGEARSRARVLASQAFLLASRAMHGPLYGRPRGVPSPRPPKRTYGADLGASIGGRHPTSR